MDGATQRAAAASLAETMATRAQEPQLRDAAEQRAWDRLEAALRVGTGHVVVTAEERADAMRLVDAALERTNALAVLRLRASSKDPLAPIDERVAAPRGEERAVSDRHEALRTLLEKARTVRANVFAVVEDADAATAEDLERIRMAVECVPDAIDRMRVVLIGTPQLDLRLREPAASALASRVSTHVRLAPERESVKGAALKQLSALRLGAAGMVTVALTSLFGRTQAVETPTASSARTSAASAPDRSAAQRVPPQGEGDAAVAPADVVPSAQAGASADATSPEAQLATAAATDAPAAVAQAAAEQLQAATRPDMNAAPTAAKGTAISHIEERLARTAPDDAAPAAPSGTAVAPAGAAASESTPASTSSPPRLKQPVVMEAAVFKDAESAYSLQKQLAERVDRVLVARLEAPRGTVYSVRVVGLETSKAVAHAEREIRTLGHRPVRLAARAQVEEGDTQPAENKPENEGRTPGRVLRPRAVR